MLTSRMPTRKLVSMAAVMGFIDGEYCDDIVMDVLKDEWLAKSKRRNTQ